MGDSHKGMPENKRVYPLLSLRGEAVFKPSNDMELI